MNLNELFFWANALIVPISILCIYKIVRLPVSGFPKEISAKNIANLEGNIPNLQSVIVIEESLSLPDPLLALVRINNLLKGVKYTHLIYKETNIDYFELAHHYNKLIRIPDNKSGDINLNVGYLKNRKQKEFYLIYYTQHDGIIAYISKENDRDVYQKIPANLTRQLVKMALRDRKIENNTSIYF